MKTRSGCNRSFQFTFPKLGTFIEVEDRDDTVVIRASRDSFSEQRKLSFIRELAAEGFIADCFQWSCQGVRWLVDASLARPSAEVVARTNRFMIRLFVGSGFLWLAMMGAAFLHDHFVR
jgi:hypothetical protein